MENKIDVTTTSLDNLVVENTTLTTQTNNPTMTTSNDRSTTAITPNLIDDQTKTTILDSLITTTDVYRPSPFNVIDMSTSSNFIENTTISSAITTSSKRISCYIGTTSDTLNSGPIGAVNIYLCATFLEKFCAVIQFQVLKFLRAIYTKKLVSDSFLVQFLVQIPLRYIFVLC